MSPFGIRMDGLRPEIHRGVDIRVPYGSEVRSMADGRVRFAGTMAGYGTVIWVDHPGGVTSVYGHLSELSVAEGAAVDGNTPIGLSGNSGNATGPHLHFEVWKGGKEQDPVRMLGGRPGN